MMVCFKFERGVEKESASLQGNYRKPGSVCGGLLYKQRRDYGLSQSQLAPASSHPQGGFDKRKTHPPLSSECWVLPYHFSSPPLPYPMFCLCVPLFPW